MLSHDDFQQIKSRCLREHKGSVQEFWRNVAQPLFHCFLQLIFIEFGEGHADGEEVFMEEQEDIPEESEEQKKGQGNDVPASLSGVCPDPQELQFDLTLTTEGQQQTPSFYREILKEYNKCSRFYEGLSEDIEIEIGSIVDENLAVQCFSCPHSSISCEDIRDNFLDETLCFPEDAKGSFRTRNRGGFQAGKCQSGDIFSKNLTLPKTFVPDEMALYDFLECRSNMGAYDNQGNLWASVEFTNISELDDELEVTCLDPCSNLAICDDILEQHESDLICVSKNDNCEPKEMTYELTFVDGNTFESKSRRYTREVESKLQENLHNYIKCRFQDDEKYDESEFAVYGELNGNTYDSICFNDCGTLPYCDALQIRRVEDSRDDPCYIRLIEANTNARVITMYDYDLEYSVDGNTQSYSYSIQSVSNDPLVRQYYGQTSSSGLPTLTASELAAQQNNFEDLMRGYGFSETDEPSYKFSNLCQDLSEHVGCASNERINKIDIEIPNGAGFKANDVKNDFGDYLETLILGNDLTASKPLPTKFFEIPSLKTLTIRGRGKLEGSIYTTIGNMINLVNLDLNQCSDTSGTDPRLTGNIPVEIQTPPLKLIDLGCNEISGTIPNAFYKKANGNPKAYKVINLNDNNLSGTISTSLNDITTLTQISLAKNGFSGSIPTLANLSKLQLLDLHANAFNSRLQQISILKQSNSALEVVSLDDNNLIGTIPTQMGQLQNLAYLNLSNNDIRGTIPSELALCTNLKVLLLDGNTRLNYNVPSELQTFLTVNNVIHDLVW